MAWACDVPVCAAIPSRARLTTAPPPNHHTPTTQNTNARVEQSDVHQARPRGVAQRGHRKRQDAGYTPAALLLLAHGHVAWQPPLGAPSPPSHDKVGYQAERLAQKHARALHRRVPVCALFGFVACVLHRWRHMCGCGCAIRKPVNRRRAQTGGGWVLGSVEAKQGPPPTPSSHFSSSPKGQGAAIWCCADDNDVLHDGRNTTRGGGDRQRWWETLTADAGPVHSCGRRRLWQRVQARSPGTRHPRTPGTWLQQC